MSDAADQHGHHPSTFKADCSHGAGFAWDDHASVHFKAGGQGVLNGLKGINRGTLAEMVALVLRKPVGEREKYVIQKAGDHTLEIAEILALARRADYPGRS